ncbi:MAG: thiamine diphosphokinase [Actinobacteria bacterium]|nr:thiamine diphosphokinase [Actinomycetota bacterium]
MNAPSHRTDAAAIVLAAGGAVDARIADLLPAAALVIAADAGLAQARALGLRPDLLVGDLDSVEPGEIASVAASGTRVERHPVEKDQIDLEIALDAARDAGVPAIVVVAGAGGRLDMSLANLLVLALSRYADIRIEAWIGTAWLAVARAGRSVQLCGRPGEIVSLVPVGGPAGGITTAGLRYPLHDEALSAGTTRGVSNELTDARGGSVSLTEGVLLVVRPDALEGR